MTKTVTEVMNLMSDRFTSANNVPIERTWIRREEWDLVVSELMSPAAEPDAGRCPTCSRYLETKCPVCGPVESSAEPKARTPTVDFMNGYVSARTDRSHLLGLLHDWFRHHANARGNDGRLVHPDLDVETQRELLKTESSENRGR